MSVFAPKGGVGKNLAVARQLEQRTVLITAASSSVTRSRLKVPVDAPSCSTCRPTGCQIRPV
jgi:hypothetical protein